MLKKHVYTILFVGWVLLITTLSLYSFSGIEERGFEIPHIDKITHFIFYFFFVVWAYLSVYERFNQKKLPVQFVFGIIFVAICYGLLIEGLQWLMPFNRAAEFGDAIANAFGAILGGLLTNMYISLNQRSK